MTLPIPRHPITLIARKDYNSTPTHITSLCVVRTYAGRQLRLYRWRRKHEQEEWKVAFANFALHEINLVQLTHDAQSLAREHGIQLHWAGLDTEADIIEDDFAIFEEAGSDGMLLYRSGGTGSGQLTVQWLDSEGKTQPLLAKPDSYLRPSLSPDGTRLAVAISDVWVYDWQRDTMTRLTFGARAIGPIWSPDGRYILFQEPGGMFWTRSDGSGKPQSLTQSTKAQVPWSITADGKRLAFHEVNQTSISIWTVALENDGTGLRAGKPELFSQTRFDESFPSFSPDGRWLAYASNESGTPQVYVRAFPGKEGKWQISNNGGLIPEWAHNGHELFFRTLDNQIMTAGYTVRDDSFVADKPRVWSEKRIANVGLLPNYGLAPDGKRIAVLMPVESSEAQKAQNHVIFVENFFDDLRRKVPLSGK